MQINAPRTQDYFYLIGSEYHTDLRWPLVIQMCWDFFSYLKVQVTTYRGSVVTLSLRDIALKAPQVLASICYARAALLTSDTVIEVVRQRYPSVGHSVRHTYSRTNRFRKYISDGDSRQRIGHLSWSWFLILLGICLEDIDYRRSALHFVEGSCQQWMLPPTALHLSSLSLSAVCVQ